MTWGHAALGIVSAVLLLVVPGTAVLRGFLDRSWVQSVLFSVPVGAGLIGIVTLLLGTLSVSWNFLTAVFSITILVVFAVVARFVKKRRNTIVDTCDLPNQNGVGRAITGTQLFWLLGGTVFFASVYAYAVLPTMGPPESVPTVGDALFHMQGLRIMGASGDATPWAPFPQLYPNVGGEQFYPTLWHAWLTPISHFFDVVAATNVGAMTLGLVFWPMGVGAFAVTLHPGSKMVALLAPVLATPIVLMPGIEVFSFAVYPFALSVALLAGTMGLLILLTRKPSWPLAFAFGFGLVGTGAAQPTSALIILAACALLAGVWALRVCRKCFERGHHFSAAGILLALSAIVCAFLVGIPQIGFIQALNTRPTEWNPYGTALEHFVMGDTYITAANMYIPALLALALAGMGFKLKDRGASTMVFTSVLLLVLFFAASGPDSYMRIFTSPWWKDASRFAIFLLVFILAFAAVTLAAALEFGVEKVGIYRDSTFVPAVTFAVVLVTVFILPSTFCNETKKTFVADSYWRSVETSIGLTENELALLYKLDDYLEEGTVVAGDPDSGAGWASILSNVEQFQGLRFTASPEQKYLGAHFDNILVDPRVCEIIKTNDITAFIRSDSPSVEHYNDYGGYRDVDLETGLELITQVGDAALYKITACD